MILYFSGGGSPWLPEMQVKPAPSCMLTVYQYTDLDSKTRKPGVWRPNGRFIRVLKSRRKAKKKEARDGETQAQG